MCMMVDNAAGEAGVEPVRLTDASHGRSRSEIYDASA